jgi:hypothetical protein
MSSFAVAGVSACAAGTGWLVGSAFTAVAGDWYAPWILGRASGISAYLLTSPPRVRVSADPACSVPAISPRAGDAASAVSG